MAVAEDGEDQRLQPHARQRQPRLPGQPVGDLAAPVAAWLDRPLVFPEPLREHRRPLEEAAPGLHPDDVQVVVIEGDEAKQQHPAAPEPAGLGVVEAEVAGPARDRHPQERPQLLVDPVGIGDPRPDGLGIGAKLGDQPDLGPPPHQPKKSWNRRKTLRAMIKLASTPARALSQRGLASSPITFLLAAMIRRGTRAKGMPKERTTWLPTRASVGSRPIASTSSAGARVIARRRKSGIWRSMKPCITTCPAIVPTEEEAKPEASRAMPKTVAARSETIACSPS